MKLKAESGCGATNWVWRISMIICVLAFAAYIVGFSTNYWVELDDESPDAQANVSGVYYDKHSGLWKRCYSYNNATTDEEITGYCEDIGNSKAYRVAAKVLCTTGLIVIFLGLVASLYSGFFNNARVLGVAGCLVIFGALTAVVGSIVLLGKSLDDDDDVDPGYSSLLAIIASGVLIGAGIALLCSIRRGYNSIA